MKVFFSARGSPSILKVKSLKFYSWQCAKFCDRDQTLQLELLRALSEVNKLKCHFFYCLLVGMEVDDQLDKFIFFDHLHVSGNVNRHNPLTWSRSADNPRKIVDVRACKGRNCLVSHQPHYVLRGAFLPNRLSLALCAWTCCKTLRPRAEHRIF